MVTVSEFKKPHFMNANAAPPTWPLRARKVSVAVSHIWNKANNFQSVSFSSKDASLVIIMNEFIKKVL